MNINDVSKQLFFCLILTLFGLGPISLFGMGSSKLGPQPIETKLHFDFFEKLLASRAEFEDSKLSSSAEGERLKELFEAQDLDFGDIVGMLPADLFARLPADLIPEMATAFDDLFIQKSSVNAAAQFWHSFSKESPAVEVSGEFYRPSSIYFATMGFSELEQQRAAHGGANYARQAVGQVVLKREVQDQDGEPDQARYCLLPLSGVEIEADNGPKVFLLPHLGRRDFDLQAGEAIVAEAGWDDTPESLAEGLEGFMSRVRTVSVLRQMPLRSSRSRGPQFDLQTSVAGRTIHVDLGGVADWDCHEDVAGFEGDSFEFKPPRVRTGLMENQAVFSVQFESPFLRDRDFGFLFYTSVFKRNERADCPLVQERLYPLHSVSSEPKLQLGALYAVTDAMSLLREAGGHSIPLVRYTKDTQLMYREMWMALSNVDDALNVAVGVVGGPGHPFSIDQAREQSAQPFKLRLAPDFSQDRPLHIPIQMANESD